MILGTIYFLIWLDAIETIFQGKSIYSLVL